ncbi:MAG: response regulator [Candidatus Limnocylindria bacterium]
MIEAGGSAQRVVLVVEDDRPVGQVLASAINDEEGYRALHVETPGDALDVLKRVHADVLVLDLALPEMSGLELYDRIRADRRYARVPVVVQTGHADEHVAELRRRGIATYVRKPFDVNLVVDYVKRLAPPLGAATS